MHNFSFLTLNQLWQKDKAFLKTVFGNHVPEQRPTRSGEIPNLMKRAEDTCVALMENTKSMTVNERVIEPIIDYTLDHIMPHFGARKAPYCDIVELKDQEWFGFFKYLHDRDAPLNREPFLHSGIMVDHKNKLMLVPEQSLCYDSETTNMHKIPWTPQLMEYSVVGASIEMLCSDERGEWGDKFEQGMKALQEKKLSYCSFPKLIGMRIKHGMLPCLSPDARFFYAQEVIDLWYQNPGSDQYRIISSLFDDAGARRISVVDGFGILKEEETYIPLMCGSHPNHDHKLKIFQS